ncbi:MAG: phosphatidate cytidylyltransferase [Treponema sp.]|jgi:phosphatidate cytidylyltransferase|nr:phosphatidate cytidylyltransferase [Treponema sp.]
MKKFVERLLIFFIGLPLTVFLVVFLPQKCHLAANIGIVVLSGLGAAELAGMFKRKNMGVYPMEAFILGISGPLAMTASVSFNMDQELVPAAFIIGASWLLVSHIFSPADRFSEYLGRTAAGFSLMIYPGFFMIWIIRMFTWSGAEMTVLIFLLIVIMNDSAAWAFGMLFGKGNKGVVPASPNKSIAGFIGGGLGSVLVGISAVLLIPEVFASRLVPGIPAGIILGLSTGGAASLGDLGESVMKRSAEIKDSGAIIPGRGGVLDTIDSIALGAPVFFAVYRLLFG